MAIRRPGIFVALSAYYFDDDAIMEAGEDAELLYVRMLAYASRQMETEGFISDRVLVSRLGILPRESGNGAGTRAGNGAGTRAGNDAGIEPGTDAGSRAGRLAEVGLIHREEGGWRIRSWLKWNKSAAELGKERTRDRLRKAPPDKAVSGNSAGTRAGNDAGIPTQSTGDSRRNDQTRPDHSLPNGSEGGPGGDSLAPPPAPPDDHSTTAKAVAPPKTARGRRLPEDWTPTRNNANQQAESGFDQEYLITELLQFRDYWKAQPGQKGVKLDWDATWRNWLRNSTKYGSKQRTNNGPDWESWEQIAATIDAARENTQT